HPGRKNFKHAANTSGSSQSHRQRPMKTLSRIVLTYCLLCLLFLPETNAQKTDFFTPADSFHSTRFYTAIGFSATAYTGFSIGLYHAWYKGYNTGSFHLFNDWGEWQHMDKLGHVYTAYMQTGLCYKGARWTGLNRKHSMMTGLIC